MALRKVCHFPNLTVRGSKVKLMKILSNDSKVGLARILGSVQRRSILHRLLKVVTYLVESSF
jgi:hypothetical protein